MNRNKVYAKSKENQMIIKALNMYGRVPETWELLEEIERLNNIINEIEKELDLNLPFKVIGVRRLKNKIKELKGSDKE